MDLLPVHTFEHVEPNFANRHLAVVVVAVAVVVVVAASLTTPDVVVE